MEGELGRTAAVVGIWLLGILYFLITVFRGAAAELNPRAISRILTARGLQSEDDKTANEGPAALRITFDVVHHLVLVAGVSLCFLIFRDGGGARPFLLGGAVVGAGAVLLQIGARALAMLDPEKALAATAFLMALFARAMRPVVAPTTWTIRRFRTAGRARRLASESEEAAEEEIEAFIDAGRQEGILEADEGNLIRQVVEFHDSIVREAMTPRTDVIALPLEATVTEARDLFAKERHSRVPVYRDRIDNIEGIIVLKDLVARWDDLPPDASVGSLMLPAYFVPETKQVSELLKEFQARRIHLAIVVDEYGGTAGVVSIEDLLEELVGEIQEEHEQEARPIVEQIDGSFLAEGAASLEDLESSLGVEFKKEPYETLAGMIYSALGRIPAVGETVESNGLRLEILEADTRRIDRVRVSRLAKSRSG